MFIIELASFSNNSVYFEMLIVLIVFGWICIGHGIMLGYVLDEDRGVEQR